MNLFGLFNRKPKSGPVTQQDLRDFGILMATKLTELAGQLSAVNSTLDKAAKEIVAAVKKLEDALGDGEIPAEAETALAELKTKAQALDDLNPDAPA